MKGKIGDSNVMVPGKMSMMVRGHHQPSPSRETLMRIKRERIFIAWSIPGEVRGNNESRMKRSSNENGTAEIATTGHDKPAGGASGTSTAAIALKRKIV